MMPEWDFNEISPNKHPNLSRCSTLVSEHDESRKIGTKVEVEKREAAVFQNSFLERFGPNYTFEEVDLEGAKLNNANTTNIDPVSTLHGHILKTIVNGWACKFHASVGNSISL
jgi:hypothetical protein